MSHRAARSAFTLVEIALAMGVIAFALTAIVGLLVTALGSSKDSTDDTIVAAMTKSIVNDLRQKPFVNLSSVATPSGSTPTGPTYGPVYFDAAGNRLLDSTGKDLTGLSTAIAGGAVYQCNETIVADANTLSTNASINLVRIQFAFQWPVAAGSNSKNSRMMYASVANY